MRHEPVSVLNHLVEVCRNGENGFRVAAERAKDPHLTSILMEYASQREQFAAQLRYQVCRLGGRPENDGTLAGALHRQWMSVRATLAGDGEQVIVSECDRGEQIAMREVRRSARRGPPRGNPGTCRRPADTDPGRPRCHARIARPTQR